jgi:hypothetical protein
MSPTLIDRYSAEDYCWSGISTGGRLVSPPRDEIMLICRTSTEQGMICSIYVLGSGLEARIKAHISVKSRQSAGADCIVSLVYTE